MASMAFRGITRSGPVGRCCRVSFATSASPVCRFRDGHGHGCPNNSGTRPNRAAVGQPPRRKPGLPKTRVAGSASGVALLGGAAGRGVEHIAFEAVALDGQQQDALRVQLTT